MKYQRLLLDADGTLLDFDRSEREAICEVLRSFSLPCTEALLFLYSEANKEQWQLLEKNEITKDQLRINRFRNFCLRAGFHCSASQMADNYENRLASKSYLLPGALETCQYLAAHYDLYLVTNGFTHIQKGRFDPSPLAPLFKGVFISENVGAEKPSVAYFDYVKKAIPNFQNDTSLMIGDSLSSDILGGIKAGLDVCWLNTAGKSNPGLPITYTISQISQLKDIL